MSKRPTRPPFKACEGCPLRERKQFVMYETPQQAKVAIIGESPATREIIDRRPFVGPSGRLVNSILEHLKLKREDFFIGNVGQCRAVGMPKTKPTAAVLEQCGWITANSMRVFGVEQVLSLGGIAMNYFKGPGYKDSIMKNRSRMFTSRIFTDPDGEEFTFKVYPTFHPAAVLRRPDGFGDLLEDFEYFFYPERKPVYEQGEYTIVSDQLQTLAILQNWAGRPIAFDLETSGYSPHEDYIICVAASAEPGTAYVFTQDVIRHKAFWSAIKNLNERGTTFLMHGGFFDHRFVFRKTGIDLNIWDTMLGNYIMDERGGVHDLKGIAAQRYGFPDWEANIKQYLKRSTIDSYAKIPRDVLHNYAGYDADATVRLHRDLLERFTPAQRRLQEEVLTPGTVALGKASLAGIAIDMEHWERLHEVYTDIVDRAKRFMQDWVADDDFNPNSFKQVQYYMYDVFDLPTHDVSHRKGHHPKLSSGRTSDLPPRTTAMDQLERLAVGYDQSEWIRALIHFRTKRKSLTSYLKGYTPSPKTGRIHPRYLVHGTRTGRLSSRDPNIMNAPHYGYIRQLIVPAEGSILVSVDYSQAELRALCALSQSQMMAQVYKEGGDLHNIVSTEIFGPGYTKRERMIAKAIVFGLVYGRSISNIAETFGLTMHKAQEYYHTFLGRFDGVEEWMENQKKFALENGYVETPTGRRRRFGLITRSNYAEVQRQAVNTPVQSVASDFMLISLTRLQPYIAAQGGNILFPLHDSIMFELPVDKWKEIVVHIVEVMEAVPEEIFGDFLPFAADCDVGWRWGDMREFKRKVHPSGSGLLPIEESLKDYDPVPEDPDWWVDLQWDREPWKKEDIV